MMNRCENCARLEDELRLTRDALAFAGRLAAARRSIKPPVVPDRKAARISGHCTPRYDIPTSLSGVAIMTVWKWKQRYPDFPGQYQDHTRLSTKEQT